MSKIVPFERVELRMKHQKTKKKLMLCKRIIMVAMGVFLAAFGLEMFLTPNQIIPGGVIGFSSLLSHMTEMQMGVFLFFLNFPFLLRHIKIVNRARAFWASFGLILLTLLIILFHPFPPLIESPPLAAFWGSLMLGIGLGITFRYGGFTDGVQQAASLIKNRFPLPTDQIIMLINLLILGLAGFIFGWQQAVYSIFGYIIILKSSEYMMHKFCIKKAVWIKSQYPELIKCALKMKFGKRIQFMTSKYYNDEIFIIIPRGKERSVQKLVTERDPSAAFSFAPIDPLLTEEINNIKLI